MTKKEYYRIGEASKLLGIKPETLREWDKKGKINVIRTESKQRLVSQAEIDRLKQERGETVNYSTENKLEVIYARVSSQAQKNKGDLDRQIGFLMTQVKGTSVKVFSDVASGLNDKRKGLIMLFDEAVKGNVSKVYITYPDRLTRFGYSYLEYFLSKFGVEIVVCKDKESKTPQEELVSDLMNLLASFSGKLYGMRNKKGKKEDITEALQETLNEFKI